MSALDVRFEKVSEGVSLLVFANLAAGWRQIKSDLGFDGLCHQVYQENDVVTVRVWVSERRTRPDATQDGFPLDLESTGSSPSKTLTYRLSNGRLAIGAYMSRVVNSHRSSGKPGFYEDGILIARNGNARYLLGFYAAVNEELPELPGCGELNLFGAESEILEPDRMFEVPMPEIEERLARISLSVEALEGRVGTLFGDLEHRLEGSLQAKQGNGAKQREELEKIAQELREQCLQQFQQQVESTLEKFRGEVKNSLRVVAESTRQLEGLMEIKLDSFRQITANGPAGVQTVSRQATKRYRVTRKELDELLARRASRASVGAQQGIGPRRTGTVIPLPSRARETGSLRGFRTQSQMARTQWYARLRHTWNQIRAKLP